MEILIVGPNYAPEPVGVGPCTTGMAEMLAKAGHQVRVVCGTPSYPQWKVIPRYRRLRLWRAVENGVKIIRLPHYVPSVPNGLRRLLHLGSFAVLAFLVVSALIVRRRPSAVVAIIPSSMAAIAARLCAGLFRLPFWVHVQDLEAEMAIATGQIGGSSWALRLARAVQRMALGGDRVSSISPAMCRHLADKRVSRHDIVEFPNWARPDVAPIDQPSPYRAEWKIDRPFVALYSGNIAAKQGVEIIARTAHLLAHRRDPMFVICGDGPRKRELADSVADCDNIRFYDLQPADRLADLLGLATIHLLPQIAGAADLVLPSKLPNMLASGRPVVATVSPQTDLGRELRGCGLIVPPDDAHAFADAIARLLNDEALREKLGRAAHGKAVERWSKQAILAGFERELCAVVAQHNWPTMMPDPGERVAGTAAARAGG